MPWRPSTQQESWISILLTTTCRVEEEMLTGQDAHSSHRRRTFSARGLEPQYDRKFRSQGFCVLESKMIVLRPAGRNHNPTDVPGY